MATAANSNPHLFSGTPADEEHWDEAIEVLLSAGEVEAARAEFERQCLVSLDSGNPILMTSEKWEELRQALTEDKEDSGDLFDNLPEGWDKPHPGSPGHAVDLLLERGDVDAAKAELKHLLLEGMHSEHPVEGTPEFFENALRKAHERAAERNVKKTA